MSEDAIKSMNLYRDVGRIKRELAAAGIDPDGPLTAAALSPYDNYHYHGTEAVDLAIGQLGLAAGSRVADIGAGIGGPARHLAQTAGCRVTALELQADLSALGAELTRRCGLGHLVDHRCGDVLHDVLEPEGYDAAVSWLCFLHIDDKPRLFASVLAALGSGGRLYVEDLSRRRTLSTEETGLLADHVYTRRLLSAEEYREELARAGFVDIDIEDVTADWVDYAAKRSETFRRDRARHEAVQGVEVAAGLGLFYDVVDRLFRGGGLGGVRVSARKA